MPIKSIKYLVNTSNIKGFLLAEPVFFIFTVIKHSLQLPLIKKSHCPSKPLASPFTCQCDFRHLKTEIRGK